MPAAVAVSVAVLTAIAVAASPAIEVAVPPGLAAGTVVAVDIAAAPTRVVLAPAALVIASTWYRQGDRVLVITALPSASDESSVLRFEAREAVAAGAAPAVFIGASDVLAYPLIEPVAGAVVALRLPERTSLRALLLGGELGGARVLFAGERLTARDQPVAERLLTLVGAGASDTLVLVAPGPADEVQLTAASLHAGYPLPAPERFRLAAGSSGSFSFEVPARSREAELSFQVFNWLESEQLRIEFEGEPIEFSPPPPPAGGFSDTLTVTLPGKRFAVGRTSLLSFFLAPPRQARDGLGIGIRRIALDRPLPAAGPFGFGPHGDGDHPGEVRFSFVATVPGAHVLRLRALDLDLPGELEVWLDGAPLATLDGAGDGRAQDFELPIPAERVAPGVVASLVVRQTVLPFASNPWAVSDVTVAAFLPPPLPAAAAPRPVPPGDGPPPSLSPLVMPGQPSPDATLLTPSGVAAPGQPGQPSDPLGDLLYFGVAVAEQPALTPTTGFQGPPRPGPAIAVAGPPFSRPSPSPPAPSGSGYDGLPGQPSLPSAPRLPVTAEASAADTRALRETRIEVASDPPGAAVFLAVTPGYRGAFVGLTPLALGEASSGPIYVRLSLPGYHEARLHARLERGGRLAISRTLLRFRGLDFSRPVDPRDPGARVAAAGYTAPVPADLDGDGRIDLVIGDQSGAVTWRRNESAAGAPHFAADRPLRLRNGRPVTVAGYAAPALADWDGDGLGDLLIGERSGHIHFFRRAEPGRGVAFEDHGLVVADGAPLGVGNDAAPLVADWDGDSRADLVVGSGYGIVVLFTGIGRGEVTQVGPLTEGGVEAHFLLDVVPVDLSDWTGDGRADLLVADMYGQVLLYPAAERSRGRFDFAPPRPVTYRGGLDLFVGTYPHGAVADLDGDGYRDLIFGNAGGEIVWLRGGEPDSFAEILPLDAALPER